MPGSILDDILSASEKAFSSHTSHDENSREKAQAIENAETSRSSHVYHKFRDDPGSDGENILEKARADDDRYEGARAREYIPTESEKCEKCEKSQQDHRFISSHSFSQREKCEKSAGSAAFALSVAAQAPRAAAPPPIDADSYRDLFEERAAIRQFDGGFSRPLAEALAFGDLVSSIDPAADFIEQSLIATRLRDAGLSQPPAWRPDIATAYDVPQLEPEKR